MKDLRKVFFFSEEFQDSGFIDIDKKEKGIFQQWGNKIITKKYGTRVQKEVTIVENSNILPVHKIDSILV